MRRLSLLIAVMLVIPVANAFEGRLAVGLAVDVERIPEPVAVNGVPMILIRVAGADVPQLAQRIEAQWRGQGSEVKAMQQGQWTLRSRMQGQRSEVVQWRAGGATAELLWSSLDARSTLLAVSGADLTLPAGHTATCSAVHAVH